MLYIGSGVYFLQIVVEVSAFGGAPVLEVVDGFVETALFGLGSCLADFDDVVELQQGGNQPFDGSVVGVVLQCDGFHGCEVLFFAAKVGIFFGWWVGGGVFFLTAGVLAGVAAAAMRQH